MKLTTNIKRVGRLRPEKFQKHVLKKSYISDPKGPPSGSYLALLYVGQLEFDVGAVTCEACVMWLLLGCSREPIVATI